MALQPEAMLRGTPPCAAQRQTKRQAKLMSELLPKVQAMAETVACLYQDRRIDSTADPLFEAARMLYKAAELICRAQGLAEEAGNDPTEWSDEDTLPTARVLR